MRIFINGETHEIDSTILSYDEIIQLAFPKTDPNIVYAVIATHRKTEFKEIVLRDCFVAITQDMRFSVGRTDNA